MKIGIVYCSYGTPEYIEESLSSWIEAKEKYDIKIAAVHGQFKEYHELGIEDNDMETLKKLQNLKSDNILDFLYVQNDYSLTSQQRIYQSESEIRNKGLQYLLSENCDIIWLLDLDEFYTIEQICRIINYIKQEDNRFFGWFSIPMKNYIFDGTQYIKGFCPPRIFRNCIKDYLIHEFYWDNDIKYKNKNTEDILSYLAFPHNPVTEHIANGGIKHITWTHSNGRLKEEYQNKHFNNICSYKFNSSENRLEFNHEFFLKNNLPLPIIYRDKV